MNIKIDKNVEIPPGFYGPINPYAEPVVSMEKNDSIKYEVGKHTTVWSAALKARQQFASREFITKKLDDQFRRIWRVK